MKLKLFTVVLLSVCSAYALQMGDIQDTTPVAITGTEYAGNVSLVSLGKAQAIADSLSEAASLKMYHYGNPTQEMTPDEAFGFDPTTGLITNYNVSVGGLDVVIPYQIGGVDVVGAGDFAFGVEQEWATGDYVVGDPITSVVFPKTFSSFGLGCFFYCTNLSSIVFNGDVIISDEDNFTFAPFSGAKLSTIRFPNATAVAGNFLSRSGVESFYGPNVKTVGRYAFNECYYLTNVVLSSATYIDKRAFLKCYSLERVELPSIMSFGSEPFTSCSNLTSIVYSGDCPVLEAWFSPTTSRIPQLAYDSIPATNYVINPTASGWGSEFGECPVVRVPASADEFYLQGTAVSTLLGAPEWIVRSGLTGTNAFENTSNRPQAWSGT